MVQQLRFDRMIRGDVAQLGFLLADEMTYVHSNSRIDSKAEFLARLASEPDRYQRITRSELATRVLGKLGLINGVTELNLKKPDGLHGSRIRFTEVSLWDGEIWKLHAWQSTLILHKLQLAD